MRNQLMSKEYCPTSDTGCVSLGLYCWDLSNQELTSSISATLTFWGLFVPCKSAGFFFAASLNVSSVFYLQVFSEKHGLSKTIGFYAVRR